MANVDITIRTITQGEKSSTSNIKASFTEINSAVQLLKQGLEALKKAYDFAKQGAELEFTASKFDRLSESIGTTSDALLTDLRSATRGMYSDMELMQSATNLVGLGLAKDSDEAIRLARVSAGLNMNMNQLVLTLTNMTTMRFDALGVRVDGFKEKVKELEEQGYDTNDAFKEAFLQQAENQLETVGEAADSSLGSFMRLEAGWKNLTDNIKRDAAETFLPLVEYLADGTQKAHDFELATEGMNDVELKAIRIKAELRDMTVVEYMALEQASEAADSATRSYMGWAEAIESARDDGAPLIDSLEEVSDKYENLFDLTMRLQGEYDNYNDKQDDIIKKKVELQEQIDDLIKLGWWPEGQKVMELKDKLGELDQALDDNAKKHEESTRRIVYSLLEQKLASDGLTDAEFAALLELGNAWGILDVNVANAASSINESISKYLDTGNLAAFRVEMTRLIELPSEKEFRFTAIFDQQGRWEIPDGLPNVPNIPQIPQAAGGDWLFTKPTMLQVAEAGSERVRIEPGGGMLNGAGGGGDMGGLLTAVLAALEMLPDNIARSQQTMYQKANR